MFILKNILLETGYSKENGRVKATETKLFHLKISEGRIAKIIDIETELPLDVETIDGKGQLVLPSFKEQHVHLDKTYMGEPWRACVPASSVIERSEIEKNILSSMDLGTEERAKNLLDVLLSHGSTSVRTHVDIYPEVGLANLTGVQNALTDYEHKVDSEIVAFAQHGLLRGNTVQLLREAVRNGAGLVGAVDPATVDLDIESSLVQLIDIAVEGNAGIDLHLHDPGHLGTFTMKRLAALTMEAGLQGKVAVSHAFGLGDVTPAEARQVAELLKEAGVSIISSVPIGRNIPPVPLLDEVGVNVALGNDNIYDSWWPTGNGDILERLGRLVEINRWTNELSLSQSLRFITNGITPLSIAGEQVWPAQGDLADFVLVDATCSAEAVARRAKRTAVFRRGALVAGELS
ncbi:amidohydrolase [Sporosarcina gallistercoris]|uniref:Amidohydrolase family protein n=1 Tax=Sporosarcina gallistercoris TaxID=2762245 RepID=A0ABR8PLN1_9BACL|nr:amidohydrolase [Sporosarcina gallistercoris]MBD7909093.1 amidohydrolase family protein [Sporosarcina gallistercoris]